MFNHVKYIYKRLEKHVSSVAFLVGFVLDNLTLRRIDFLLENIAISAYIISAMFGIFCMHMLSERNALFRVLKHYMPLVTQFAFGGLFSAFFVFYSRSADLGSSWPFLLILIAVMVGNEFFHERSRSFIFQTGVLFLGILSYAIFLVPVIVGRIGDSIFLVSVVISLCIMFLCVQGAHFFAPLFMKKEKKKVYASTVSIVAVVSMLYFFHIIPPIPLALKEAGVYHSVSRTNTGYVLKEEVQQWYTYVIPGETIHIQRGESLSVWSSVFAPTKFTTSIIHEWQYYDEEDGRFYVRARVPFSIVGGRDGGYRGFSTKTNITTGRWRVRIETLQGQRIGEKEFDVEIVDAMPEMREIVR